MGGWDTYCKLTGAYPGACEYWNERGLEELVSWEFYRDNPSEAPELHPSLIEALKLSEESIESLRSAVLLCPWKEENVQLYGHVAELQKENTVAPLSEIEQWSIRPFYDIDPQSGMSDLGCCELPHNGEVIGIDQTGNFFIWTAAYRICCAAVPRFIDPYMLWIALRCEAWTDTCCGHEGASTEHQFRPGRELETAPRISRAPWEAGWEQYHAFSAVLRRGHDQEQFNAKWTKIAATQRALTKEEKHEIMSSDMGLWPFVRPDRFPVQEAFSDTWIPTVFDSSSSEEQASSPSSLEALPPETFQLILENIPDLFSALKLASTSKGLRRTILAQLDFLAEKYIQRRKPWLKAYAIPSMPEPELETDWWTEQVEKAAWRSAEENRFPWARYLKASEDSASMKCRKRIWEISKDLEKIAEAEGLFDRVSDEK